MKSESGKFEYEDDENLYVYGKYDYESDAMHDYKIPRISGIRSEHSYNNRNVSSTLDALVNALIKAAPEPTTPTQDAINIVVQEHPGVNVPKFARLLLQKPEIAQLVKNMPNGPRIRLIENELNDMGFNSENSSD
jgi:hypothetical protein